MSVGLETEQHHARGAVTLPVSRGGGREGGLLMTASLGEKACKHGMQTGWRTTCWGWSSVAGAALKLTQGNSKQGTMAKYPSRKPPSLVTLIHSAAGPL